MQTSVRLSPPAFAALEAIKIDRGVSRDAAVRRLLEEYVAAQSDRSEDERLTHISTVLRYPPRPAARSEVDDRVRVAFRASAETVALAMSFALRLPGQPVRRGPRDYSPRPLTDALNVAIASVRPFIDAGLEDLPTVISQAAALGLWRLTVAATLSRAEQRVVLTAPSSDLALILQDEDVAWHAPMRFEVALHIARKLFAGEDGAGKLRMVEAQRDDFAALLHEFARTEWEDSPLLRDCPAVGRLRYEGRGGAAVWRAERKLTMTHLARWVVHDGAYGEFRTLQPQWTVASMPGWFAIGVGRHQPLGPSRQRDVDSRRVLRVRAGSWSALWPYAADGTSVPGFGAVLAAAGPMEPASIVELVLLTEEHVGDPWVPAELACDWGFISPEARDGLIRAAAVNRHRAVKEAPRHHLRDEYKLEAELRRHLNDPDRFVAVARQQGVRGGPFRAAHRWEVGSVGALLERGAPDEQVKWLVGAVSAMRARLLEGSMRHASMTAYWHGRPDADQIV